MSAIDNPPKSDGAESPDDPVPSDPVLRAAWAHYMEDMGQREIAAMLGVSRATVHNHLRQARASGLVRISIDPVVTARSRAARALADRFGLEAAHLVPCTGDDPGAMLAAVVRAAGLWLDDLVPRGASLGVAWGETVHALAAALPRRARADLTVVQLVGSMASPFGFNAEACSSLIAERFGAACVNLYAPAVLGDAATAQTLLAEPVIAKQMDRLNACDAAVFAVGLCDRASHVVQAGVATPDELDAYLHAGAAAVIAGRFVDERGRVLPGPLDGRVIGIALDTLRDVPRRIVVSSGPARVPALLAALRGGFATHLVTDAATAEQLKRAA